MTHSSRALQSHDLSREGINFDSHKYFFDHTRTWRASPDEWSAQCHCHPRDNTNIKDDTQHSLTRSLILTSGYDKDDYDGQMIFGEPCGPKASWHLSYRRRKTQIKPHPGNLSRPGIEPGPAAWQARMLPPAPQRWTWVFSKSIKYAYLNICEYFVLNWQLKLTDMPSGGIKWSWWE